MKNPYVCPKCGHIQQSNRRLCRQCSEPLNPNPQKGEVIETPRVDEAEKKYDDFCRYCYDNFDSLPKVDRDKPPDGWDVARTLERALISAERERDDAKYQYEMIGLRIVAQKQEMGMTIEILQQKLSTVEQERDELQRKCVNPHLIKMAAHNGLMSFVEMDEKFSDVIIDRDSILGEYRKALEQVRHTYKYLSMSSNHLMLIAAQELLNVIDSETAKRILGEQNKHE